MWSFTPVHAACLGIASFILGGEVVLMYGDVAQAVSVLGVLPHGALVPAMVLAIAFVVRHARRPVPSM